jgi:hypothetical protein
MKYSRYIEVAANLVFFNGEDSVELDCSALKNDRVAFVIEAGGQMWVELDPFEGRVYEYDFSYALALFEQAEKVFVPEPDFPEEPVEPTITVLQGLLALDRAGLADAYEQWAKDPARTFVERAYIERALNWRRSDPILSTAAQTLGLSETQLDELFALAATL